MWIFLILFFVIFFILILLFIFFNFIIIFTLWYRLSFIRWLCLIFRNCIILSLFLPNNFGRMTTNSVRRRLLFFLRAPFFSLLLIVKIDYCFIISSDLIVFCNLFIYSIFLISKNTKSHHMENIPKWTSWHFCFNLYQFIFFLVIYIVTLDNSY